jgi:dihydrofolate reductase
VSAVTRVRLDLFSSLDGYTAQADADAANPMGADWAPLTAAYTATRTFRREVFGDDTGAGTTGVDDAYAAAFFTGVGSEIMGAGMFGLHVHGDDPDWRGWWGDAPPFRCPVYVLTHTAPRPRIEMPNGTVFHFRSDSPERVLTEAVAAAGGLDVRIGGGIRTARTFLRAGLVDDLHVGIAPIVLDRGAPVWEHLRGLERTHALSTEVAESGTVHVTFRR